MWKGGHNPFFALMHVLAQAGIAVRRSSAMDVERYVDKPILTPILVVAPHLLFLTSIFRIATKSRSAPAFRFFLYDCTCFLPLTNSLTSSFQAGSPSTTVIVGDDGQAGWDRKDGAAAGLRFVQVRDSCCEACVCVAVTRC